MAAFQLYWIRLASKPFHCDRGAQWQFGWILLNLKLINPSSTSCDLLRSRNKKKKYRLLNLLLWSDDVCSKWCPWGLGESLTTVAQLSFLVETAVLLEMAFKFNNLKKSHDWRNGRLLSNQAVKTRWHHYDMIWTVQWNRLQIAVAPDCQSNLSASGWWPSRIASTIYTYNYVPVNDAWDVTNIICGIMSDRSPFISPCDDSFVVRSERTYYNLLLLLNAFPAWEG